MTELPLEGVPPRLFVCTPTRLTTWVDCPRRYRYTYLDRPPPPKGPPWAHLSLGASVHNALRDWWGLPVAERTAAAAERLVRRDWLPEGFKDDAQSAQYRDVAATWVADYVTGLDRSVEPLGVERTVAWRTDRLAFSGRVDRIDVRPINGVREAVVVDYKTGRRPVGDEEARSSLALALYAPAVSRTLRLPCVQVELHHLPTRTVAVWRHDDRTLSRHLRRATDIADEAQAAQQALGKPVSEPVTDSAAQTRSERFQPNPGAGCAWCDYRSVCPEGQAASNQAQPWAALPSADTDA
jgi:RecB family exonuclease